MVQTKDKFIGCPSCGRRPWEKAKTPDGSCLCARRFSGGFQWRFHRFVVSGGNRPAGFFPASGYYNGTSLNNRGSNGNYWSSSWNSDTNAYNLNFNSGNVNPQNNNNRRLGCCVLFSTYLDAHTNHSEALGHITAGYRLTRERLLSDLYIAFYDARRHKAKMSYVVQFEKNLKENMEQLCDDLWTRRYTALPSKCFIIDYPKKREVFAAMFRDRIVHHLYYNYTHLLFERTFIADSYSCIPGRGTHYGISRLRQHIRSESQNWTRPCYCMNLDIRGYFMHIDRRRLLDIATSAILRMASHPAGCPVFGDVIANKWHDILDIDFILWLTEQIVMLDPVQNCEIIGTEADWQGLDHGKSLRYAPPGCGLPIGNLTSQLFSNVYMNVFDQWMKRIMCCRHYGRYVDDSNVVDCSHDWLLSIVPDIRDFLDSELGLELHMGKLRIQEVRQGVEFLGAFVKPYRDYISNKTLQRIETGMKQLDLSNMRKALQTVNSYMGVLSHAATYNLRHSLFDGLPLISVPYFAILSHSTKP